MSQRQDIYNHLMTGASITPITALNLFGCFSLSQRLGELRRHFGVPILSKTVENADGKRYACYWLDKTYIAKVKAGEIKGYGV
ncbi:helix-turn-helix domain-containing protein [Moraxella bovis]|nr:helix-turn-helix domain-containing protein [Moraxella bovis]UYZ74796.1 helix-turn-helix domain-containing protein [Moraxella bovis]UYZ86585.1 helix-turn-helix domain-containing protein [Moraxella bovis]UYZ96901.1 helix-turn-helix domain-containing protein [Moraxella bovis]UYZ98072.1 helix-turn-helix domain-containing protein [Moraxella bovis]UYZ99564.1 helix-turn-helix domain-containing protein [Moraxella bovis]